MHAGPVFVGRQRELAELRAGLEDAVGGRGRFFLVVGEAGIGKTRLAEELAREAAERGGVALWGRCWEGEGAPPYWPWVQVIRALLQGVPAEELRPAVGAGAPYLVPLVPELGERFRDLPALSTSPRSEHARFYLFDAVATLLRSAAQRTPLVLVLDDLQWADAPSLLLCSSSRTSCATFGFSSSARTGKWRSGRPRPWPRSWARSAATATTCRCAASGRRRCGASSRRRSAGARRRCSSVPSIGRPRAIPSSSTRSCACSLPSERSSGTRTRARGGFRCRRACARRSAAASRPCRRPPGRPLRSHRSSDANSTWPSCTARAGSTRRRSSRRWALPSPPRSSSASRAEWGGTDSPTR